MKGCLAILLLIALGIFVVYLLGEYIAVGFLILLGIAFLYNTLS